MAMASKSVLVIHAQQYDELIAWAVDISCPEALGKTVWTANRGLKNQYFSPAVVGAQICLLGRNIHLQFANIYSSADGSLIQQVVLDHEVRLLWFAGSSKLRKIEHEHRMLPIIGDLQTMPSYCIFFLDLKEHRFTD